MTRTITLIPGDRIGAEVSAAVAPDPGGSSVTTEFADAICHPVEGGVDAAGA